MISNIALAFLLIFFAGSFAALFVDPAYGVFLYIFEYFLRPPGRWWWGDLPHLRFAYIIALITMTGYIIRRWMYAKNKIFDLPQTKWLLLFAILMVLTWPVAADKTSHEKFLTIFIKYLILYFLIVKTVDTPKKFERMIGSFLLGQFYFGWLAYTIGRNTMGRLEGIGGPDSKDANMTAAVLVVSVPILINYLITGKKWQKICSLPILAFVLNALVLVNSRGAFIAVAISVGYYFYCSMSSPSFIKSHKLKIIAGMAGGIILFLYLADPIFWERMSTLKDPTIEGSGSRMYYWFKTFDVLRDHPFGVGARGFEVLSPNYLPPDALSPETNTRAVHSTYFQVLSEYGYHGFVLFMVFLYSNFRYMKKLKKELVQKKFNEPYFMAIALEAGFLAHLVAAIFIDRLYSEVLYWTSAFIAAYGNIYFKEIKRLVGDVDKREGYPEGG